MLVCKIENRAGPITNTKGRPISIPFKNDNKNDKNTGVILF
jgi:hypothetical protein